MKRFSKNFSSLKMEVGEERPPTSPYRTRCSNELCGIDEGDDGYYIVEGTTALAEALKVNTTIKNIECATI